jgi:flagellar hook-associated protein 2
MANTISTGSSNFSNDFQQVITRAVAIASLPITQLQNDVGNLQSQSSSLTALQSSFASLQTSLTSLETAMGTGSFTSSVSDSEVASAGLTGTPMPGTFSITVENIGAFSTSMSKDGFPTITDIAKSSLSDAASYTLTVGTQSYWIEPSSPALSSLADAINNELDAGVQANLVNVGTATSPDYRLSVSGSKYGDLPIQLTADDGSLNGQTLLAAGETGAAVSYKVNGKPDVAISSDSRIISPAPGVSVTLLKEGTTSVTVARSANAVSSAFAAFAKAYNGVVSELDKNHGEKNGALQGQSILKTVSDALHRIAGYSTGSGGISSLAGLGLGFEKDGTMSFDSSVFSAAAKDRFSAISDFLGTSKQGGFLKSASDAIQLLTASDTGVISQTISMVQSQITRTNASIDMRQDRVDALEERLQAQMAAADALIAQLEQQATFMTNMFQAMTTDSKNQ